MNNIIDKLDGGQILCAIICLAICLVACAYALAASMGRRD